MAYKFLFGPVLSRRLGISLGVDIVSAKTCNLNCVYCECGETSCLSGEITEHVRIADVIAELQSFLSTSPKLDIITITGSGEPTLNSGLGDLIHFLKTHFSRYTTALLTNGTLLHDKDVSAAAMQFDYVLPSLDAVSNKAFSLVNRPHGGLSNEQIIDGLIAFSRLYKGILWLEVFIVPGINDSPIELSLLKHAAEKINPTRVQLNTLDRPGAVDSIVPASHDQLLSIAHFFKPLPVEIISRQYQTTGNAAVEGDLRAAILETLKRRPLTIEDIAKTTGHNINDITSTLSLLCRSADVASENVGAHRFYKLTK